MEKPELWGPRWHSPCRSVYVMLWLLWQTWIFFSYLWSKNSNVSLSRCRWRSSWWRGGGTVTEGTSLSLCRTHHWLETSHLLLWVTLHCPSPQIVPVPGTQNIPQSSIKCFLSKPHCNPTCENVCTETTDTESWLSRCCSVVVFITHSCTMWPTLCD